MRSPPPAPGSPPASSRSILFVVRDPLPPTRADVRTLFGTEMPRHGVATALVGQGGSGDASVGGHAGPYQVSAPGQADRTAGALAPPRQDISQLGTTTNSRVRRLTLK